MKSSDNPFSLAGIDPDLREHIKSRCRELRGRQTPAEERLWQAIRNRQIAGVKFYRQAPLVIMDRGDTGFYIVDFYCHECRLAIELDGKIHLRRKEYDQWRSEIIQQYNIRIKRWKNDIVMKNFNDVIEELTTIVKQQKHMKF